MTALVIVESPSLMNDVSPEPMNLLSVFSSKSEMIESILSGEAKREPSSLALMSVSAARSTKTPPSWTAVDLKGQHEPIQEKERRSITIGELVLRQLDGRRNLFASVCGG